MQKKKKKTKKKNPNIITLLKVGKREGLLTREFTHLVKRRAVCWAKVRIDKSL